MQTYFLGLLGAATVLIGIAVAFLVAFVQIAAGRFSAAVATPVLRDWQVRVWLVGLALMFAGLGGACLILSLPPPRPPLGPLTHDQERVIVALVGLASVLAGLGFVIGLVSRAISFNSAPRLAEEVVRAVRAENLLAMIDEGEAVQRLRNRAIGEKWQEALTAAAVAREFPTGLDEKVDKPDGTPANSVSEWSNVPFTFALSGDVADDGSTVEENRPRHTTKIYPLLPIIELLNKAVRDGDRITVYRTLETMGEQWSSWLKTAHDDVRRELVVDAVRETLLESVVELIDGQGVPSLYLIYLPEVGRLAQQAYEIQPSLLRGILAHLTQTVVRLILRGEDDAAAAGVKALFGLERSVHENPDAAIAVHQALGSIGRTVGRLLPDQSGFAFNSPGFGYLDTSQSSVLFALREGYSELAQGTPTVGNPADARIWLEAAEVTVSSLLERAVETGEYHAFREHVGVLAGDLFRGVETLTYRGADVCLSIGLLALKRFADAGVAPDEEAIWETIGTCALRLGMIAEDRDHHGFAGRSGADDAIAVFACVPDKYRSDLMIEVYVHPPKPVGHEAVWRFVKRAGVKLRTNFDMTFDPVTGEDYAKDDPRRR